MGCDIHWIIEKRYRNPEPDNVWVGVAMKYNTPALPVSANLPDEHSLFIRPIYSGRDYAFFAALAGVRGDGPDPRGVPPDVSTLARTDIDSYGTDGHSHSWATLLEFVLAWLEVNKPQAYGVCIAALAARRLDGTPLSDEAQRILGYYTGISWLNELDDYRVVYYFDN